MLQTVCERSWSHTRIFLTEALKIKRMWILFYMKCLFNVCPNHLIKTLTRHAWVFSISCLAHSWTTELADQRFWGLWRRGGGGGGGGRGKGLLNLWKTFVWQVLKIQYVSQKLLVQTQIHSSAPQNGRRSEAISASHITLMGGGLHRLSGAACCGFPRRQQAYKSGKWRWWDTVPSASFSCHSL